MPVLASLHWLPLRFHIDFKILLYAFKMRNGLASPSLADLVSNWTTGHTNVKLAILSKMLKK